MFTKPIIDLFKNVQTIINTHQSEKEELIKMQQNKGQYDEQIQIGKFDKMKSEKDDNKDYDIMLNYKPYNKEINTLYRAFSNLTKTIKVARDSLYQGDDN